MSFEPFNVVLCEIWVDGSDVDAVVEFCLLGDLVYDGLRLRHVAGTSDLRTKGQWLPQPYILQLTDRLKLH